MFGQHLLSVNSNISGHLYYGFHVVGVWPCLPQLGKYPYMPPWDYKGLEAEEAGCINVPRSIILTGSTAFVRWLMFFFQGLFSYELFRT